MSRRSILTTIIIPIVLISGLIIFLINNRREYLGELVLTKEQLDFGIVPEWKGQVSQTLIARNIGKSSIQITRIQTGCSYADIKGPKVISPDSDATFKVLLDPQFLPDSPSTATAIIFTDSPKTPQLYLTIVANAKRFATLSTEICDFGEILTETPYEQNIKLCVNAPLEQERIRLLPTEHQLLRWKLTPDPKSECYIINIQLMIPKRDIKDANKTSPRNFSELFSTSLTIAFSNNRTLTLPIVAKIVEPVSVKPDNLSFGIVQKGAVPSIRFTLVSKSQIKVLDIKAPEYLKVGKVTNPAPVDVDSSDYRRHFEVTWDTSKSHAFLRTNININTSASPISIRVPVYGYIQSDQQTKPSPHQKDE